MVYLIWFFVAIIQYKAFSKISMGKVQSFYVKPLSKGRYGIGALYTYSVGEQTFQNEYIFEKPYFLNEYAAENNLKYWNMKEMKVWYKKKSPEISVLQKNFPYKTMVYMIVVLCLNIYFSYLKWFMVKNEYFSSNTNEKSFS